MLKTKLKHSTLCSISELADVIISERELTFTFAVCRRTSVCLSSVTFVRPTQVIEILACITKCKDFSVAYFIFSFFLPLLS